MSWRDWFRSARRATPIADVPSAGSARDYGPGASGQPNHEILLRENLGIADAATRAIANRLASLQLQVVIDRRSEDGTIETEVIDDHPLAMIFAKPHPNFSMRSILRLTGQWIVTVGEAYWQKVNDGFGVPRQLHPIIPRIIEPKVVSGMISEYLITDADGKQYGLPPEEIVRIWFPDPENPWRSEGYIGPSAVALDANKFANEMLRAFYQFDATPKVVLEGDVGAEPPPKPGTPEGDRYWARWAQDYQRRHASGSQGVPRPIAPGWKAHELTGGADAATKAYLDHWRDELLMTVGGVPRSVLGQVVSGDRSSAEVNQWVFDMYAVTPIALMIEDALTSQLASSYESAVRVKFAPFVSVDKEFELKREEHDLEHGVRTINKVLTDREDDEVKWGEKPLIASTLKVFDPNEKPAPPGQPLVPPQPPRSEREAHIAVRKAFRGKSAA